MKIKVNRDNEDLFCIYSKERIEIGERYVLVEEEYLGEIIKKCFKLEYAPEDLDEIEPWISSEE